MPNVFDTIPAGPVAPAKTGNVFDSIPAGNVFDSIPAWDPAKIQAGQGVGQPGEFGPAADNSEFLTAIGRNPSGFLKSLPGDVLSVGSGVGDIARSGAADLVSKVAGDPQYGGNLEAMQTPGIPLPVDTFLGKVAQTNPNLATAGKVAQGVAQMAPAGAVGMLPSWAVKLASLGFSADMIAKAPATFKAYAEEINKPPDQQDPDKLSSLKSDIIQTFAFAPLAGAHGAGGTLGRLTDTTPSAGTFKGIQDFQTPAEPSAVKPPSMSVNDGTPPAPPAKPNIFDTIPTDTGAVDEVLGQIKGNVHPPIVAKMMGDLEPGAETAHEPPGAAPETPASDESRTETPPNPTIAEKAAANPSAPVTLADLASLQKEMMANQIGNKPEMKPAAPVASDSAPNANLETNPPSEPTPKASSIPVNTPPPDVAPSGGGELFGNSEQLPSSNERPKMDTTQPSTPTSPSLADQLQSNSKFRAAHGVHIDVRPGAEGRIDEIMSNGLNSGYLNDITKEGKLGWAEQAMSGNRGTKAGDIAYVVKEKGLKVRPGTKPVSVVRFTKDGQSLFDALRENKNVAESVGRTPGQSAEPILKPNENPKNNAEINAVLAPGNPDVTAGGNQRGLATDERGVGIRSPLAAGTEGIAGQGETPQRGAGREERAELPDDGEAPTGIRNAVIDRERKARGDDEVTPNAKYTFESKMDAAKAHMEANPTAQSRLVSDLIENPRPISGHEPSMLAHWKVGLDAEYTKAANHLVDAVKSGDPARIAEATTAEQVLAKHRTEFEQMLRKVGGLSSEGLNLRRIMLNSDYSLAAMLERAEAAKGAPLEPKEIEQISDLQKAREDAQQAEDKNRGEHVEFEADKASQEHFRTLLNEPKAYSKPVMDWAHKFVNKLDSAANAARERIKARQGRLTAGLDPTDLADHAIVGASHIAHLGLDFAKWSAKMVSEFGQGIKPHLDQIYDAARKQLDGEAKASGGGKKRVNKKGQEVDQKATMDSRAKAVGDAIKDKVDPKEFAGTIRQMARDVVQSGVRDRDKMVDTVHEALKSNGVDLTLEQTRDAISGYGDYRELSKDEVSVELRRMKGELQKVAQLEALQKGQSPLKSGVEHAPLSDEARRIAKQVNQLKNELGLKPEDPTRALKTALESKKTRLNNQIKDLQREIDTREKIVPEKKDSPTDAETDALTKQRDALKAQRDDIFGKPELTDAQRLKAAENAAQRSLDAWEKKLADAKQGKFEDDGRPEAPKSDKLDAIRAQRDAAKAEVDHLKSVDPGQRDIAGAEKLEAQRQSLTKSIAEMERKIREGDIATGKKPVDRPASPELEKLKQQRDALAKQINDLRHPEKTPDELAAMALARRKASLTKSIATIHDKIARGDFSKKSKKLPVFDKEIGDLMAKKEKAENDFHTLEENYRKANRTKAEKIREGAVYWSRVAKLSSPQVVPKLMEAGIIRLVTDPLQRIAAQPLRLIPGFADKAIYQLGLSRKAEVDSVAALLKAGPAALQKLKTGHTNIDYHSGKPTGADREMMSFVGNIHGMVKEPVRQAIFNRSIQLRTELADRQGLDIKEPAVQQSILSSAASDANKGIFMGENAITKFLTSIPQMLMRNSKEGDVKALADTMNFLMPIVRVSTNIAIATVRLNPIVGLGEAGLRLAGAAKRGELKNNAAGLSEENAAAISRAYALGSIGMVLGAYAWLHPQYFGGIYSNEDPKKPAGMKTGQLKVMGVNIPSWMNHAPEINFMQTIASARRAYDRYYTLPSKPHDPVDRLTDVMSFTLMSPVKDFPQVNTWLRMFGGEQSMGQAAGATVRDAIIPGAITSTMARMDSKARTPHSFWQEMEMGIPGLRQTVPESKKQ